LYRTVPYSQYIQYAHSISTAASNEEDNDDTMETPLLAADGDNVTPSLSSGPAMIIVAEEESEFSRLIAQCGNPFSLILNDHFEVDQGLGGDHVMLGLSRRGRGGRGAGMLHDNDNRNKQQQTSMQHFPRGPWITALAATLSLVQICLIWTSYMPLSVWTSCHLHISINWQHDYLPFLDDFTDMVIQTTNLASLLQALCGASGTGVGGGQILLVLALCIASLLLPCACMIVGPVLVVMDYQEPVNLLQRSRQTSLSCSTFPRGVFEVCMRWAWMTGHLLILLSMSTSFLELHWTDTWLRIDNRFNGPLAAYMLGITAAVGLVVLLRLPATEDDKTRLSNSYSYPGEKMTGSSSAQIASPRHHSDGANFQMLRTPPPHAFQHVSFPPLQLSQDSGGVGVVQDDDEPAMTVLEEEELPSPTSASAAAAATERGSDNNGQAQQPARPQHPLPARSYSYSSPSTPDLVSEESFVQERMDMTFCDTATTDHAVEELTFWQKFTAFQLGLLSTVLWIPALYLPMLIVSYSGVAREFLQTSSLRIFVWQVPSTIWQQQAGQTTTPVWILIFLIILLLVTMLILPVLATCLGILAWLGEGKWSNCSQAWLYAIHPALGGIVFSVALLGTVHALTPLGEYTLNHQETWGICKELKQLSGEPCLAVHARLLPGAWFYLVQSIVLETFVIVTLRWCSSRE
jgi:hypothetical protein